MEKQAGPPFEPQPLYRSPKKQTSLSKCVVAFVAGCLVYLSFTGWGTRTPSWSGKTHEPTQHPKQQDYNDIWDILPSKPYLDYQTCYDDFQCARLQLPMDYWNGTTNATVSVAVVKLPAKVPITDPQYGGAVLHNPGGPGGSGVGFLLGAGYAMQEIIGQPDGLQYDHISFDPRGILFTTPGVECFDDPEYELFWAARNYEEGLYSSSDAAFGRLWSMSIAGAGSCSLPPEDGSPDIKQYVNTAYVARDMLEIVERHGEWREAEAKRLLKKESGCKARSGSTLHEAEVEVPDRLKYHPGEEKLNYWGFSYGTYLGNTFAAMYPERVNRLIVDGVVDAYDYRKALWLDNLVDTEKDLDLLYYHCARVGYPKCKLGEIYGNSTVDTVKARVNNLTAALYHNPLPIIYRGYPDIITYSDIKGFLFAGLYSPIGLFPIIAEILHDIETGAIAEQDTELRAISTIKSLGAGAQMAIACSDGESQSGVGKHEFREHIKQLEALSPNLGEIWASLRLSCIHYKVRSPYRFTADWTGKTAHPIIEIGNTADPVTPGRYAKKMAKGFEGAVALIQDSPGHCSLAAPSNCTISYVRDYFQTGELPEEGTVCPADEVPFGSADGDGMVVLNAEAQRMRENQRVVAQALLNAHTGYSVKVLGRPLE